MLLSLVLFAFAAAAPVPPPASEPLVSPTPPNTPARTFPAGLSPPTLRRQTAISNQKDFEKELVRSSGFTDAIAQEAEPSAWELFIKAMDKELEASGKKLADQLKKSLASARIDGHSSASVVDVDLDWKESMAATAERNLKTFPMIKEPAHRRQAPLTRDEWKQVVVEMKKAEQLQEHRAQIASDKMKWQALKSQFTSNTANPLGGAEAAQTVSNAGTSGSASSVATAEETSNLFVRLGKFLRMY